MRKPSGQEKLSHALWKGVTSDVFASRRNEAHMPNRSYVYIKCKDYSIF